MAGKNFYDGQHLDRVSHLRDDPKWRANALADGASVLVPVWRTRNLVAGGEEPRAVLARLADYRHLADENRLVLLGLVDDIAHFALDLSHIEVPDELIEAPEAAEFTDLRRVGALMPHGEGALLAYARGILHWHGTHRFCGRCGAETEMRQSGHMRRCVNDACAAEHFPRTDPAIIVVVHRGEKALLGRQAVWKEGMYSALAGFVEPGESLEQAVAREVFEETAIEISNIRYHSSQPWPFPASLMLGFHATAETEDITVDDELEDARWFTRDEIENSDMGFARRPRSDSIARRLMEDWVHRRI